MFEKYYGKARELLVPKAEYKPFPSIDDREVWDNLHPEQKDYFLKIAEDHLNYDWPSLPAVRYMDYCRNGNRSRYAEMERRRRAVMLSLSIAECIENKGRFIDDIINGLWAVMDEASWVSPAHNGTYPPAPNRRRMLPPTTRQDDIYVDLFAGDTGCMLAAILSFLQPRLDAVTPMITERMRYELNRRVLRPFVEHDDMPWMGNGVDESFINNWTPWVTSDCLAVITEDEDTRVAVVEKALVLEDRYLETIHNDGSCEEGARYWNVACNATFAGLDLLYGLTGGKVNVYQNEKIQSYADYGVSMHIDERMVTLYADNDLYLNMTAQGMWLIARRVGNKRLEQLALYLRRGSFREQIGGDALPMDLCKHEYPSLQTLLCYADYAAQPAVNAPYLQDSWYPGIQVMTARQKEGEKDGLFFSARGGTNGESHNHNDVGSFILFSDGKPAVIDMGSGEYHADSFSMRRYEVNKQVNSGWHNLPMAGGVQQKDGREYAAKNVEYTCEADMVRFSLNIEGAYPAESPIRTWHRAYTFDRTAETLTMVDDFELKQPDTLESVLMTANEPVWENGALRIRVEGGRDVMMTCTEGWMPTTEKMDLSGDANFRNDWNGVLYRTIFRPAEKMESGTMTMTFWQK